MTDKKAKAPHTRAKGTTTNGKPAGRSAGRAASGAKRASERERTSAKPAKKPRQEGESPLTGAGEPAGASPSAQSPKLGLARLKQEAQNMVERDVKKLLKGLKARAGKGSASDVKLLLNLARLNEQESTKKPEDGSRLAMLQHLASEPEYREASGGKGDFSAQPGIHEPVESAAEKSIEIENDIA